MTLSSQIVAAILRVATAHPNLVRGDDLLQFAQRVADDVSALEPARSQAANRAYESFAETAPLPNFFQSAADGLLAGIVDDLLDLRRTVQLGPPFDRAELAAQLYTIGINGEACWQYLHTYVEASSCAGTA